MRSWRKGAGKIALLIVLSTLTATLGGCASGKAGQSDLSEITIGIPQDLDGLDPHRATAAGTKEVLFNIFEGLVKPDAAGDLQPAIAENYSIENGGQIYRFALRSGVRFHDNTEVTAEDVKYSLERAAGLGGGEPIVAALSKIESVEIKDAHTVEINLNTQDTDFLPYLTVAIVPQHIEDLEKQPIGTGPYKFVSRSPQENVVLTRFDNYWGEKAYLRDVTLKIESNPDAIVMDLQGGSIDMFARLTTVQVDQLSRDQFTIYEGTMNLVQAMYLNNAEKPFDDVRVRQALCYAIDPQQIMDFVSGGAGTELGSSMFPAFTKYYLEELNHTYDQDLDKARELLTEAGYPDGFSFMLTVPSNYTQHVDTAQVLKEQLAKIGVDAQIQGIEWNSWLSDVYSGRKFQATVVGVDAANLTPSALLSRFVSDAGNNFCNYSNPAYDEAFAKAYEATNDADRTHYIKECERILSETAANVYIQDLPEFVALNKKYTGYTFYPLYVQDIAKLRPAAQ